MSWRQLFKMSWRQQGFFGGKHGTLLSSLILTFENWFRPVVGSCFAQWYARLDFLQEQIVWRIRVAFLGLINELWKFNQIVEQHNYRYRKTCSDIYWGFWLTCPFVFVLGMIGALRSLHWMCLSFIPLSTSFIMSVQSGLLLGRLRSASSFCSFSADKGFFTNPATAK